MVASNGVAAAAEQTARDRQGSNRDEFAERRGTTEATRNIISATHPKTDRRRSHRVPKLAEAIVISQFWRNRRGEAIVVQLLEFEGHVLADVRVHFTSHEGKLQPTRKGISIAVRHLPELAAALVKAEKKARELGLIPGEEAGRE